MGQGQNEFGAIAKREGEKSSRQEIRWPDQDEIERAGLAQHGQTQGDLPGSAEPKVAPGPGPKDRKQGQENPSA